MIKKTYLSFKILIFAILFSQLTAGCYSYRIATHAQGGTEPIKVIGKSYAWGLLQNPPLIATPVCDSLESRGMSGIRVKKNFGRNLVTLITLGFYSAVEIEYQCGKPTPKTVNPL
jgi:Bor protein